MTLNLQDPPKGTFDTELGIEVPHVDSGQAPPGGLHAMELIEDVIAQRVSAETISLQQPHPP